METMEVVRRRLTEYMNRKGYLDSNKKISAPNNAYDWHAIDVSADPNLMKLIHVPRGYLLGGIQVHVLGQKPNSSPENFFTSVEMVGFPFALAEAIAKQYSLDFNQTGETGSIRGTSEQFPFRLNASFITPQKGAMVATKTIDSLVEAIRILDTAVNGEHYREMLGQHALDYEAFLNQTTKKVIKAASRINPRHSSST